MRAKFTALGLAVCLSASATAVSAQDLMPRDNGIFTYHEAPRWRESESHPIRVLSYLAHPVGWALREGIFRPWSAFASSTPFTRSFWGFREPFDYRQTICFAGAEAIPDCRQLAPYTNVAAYRQAAVDTAGGSGEAMGGMVGGERQVFFPSVNFDFDKSNLNDLGRGKVRQIAQLLSSVPTLAIVVEGHADFKGTDEYNQNLGAGRAQSVIDELTQLGVDPARLSPISYGESKPIFTEEEDWARAVNRRVQFSVKGETEAPPAEQPPA